MQHSSVVRALLAVVVTTAGTMAALPGTASSAVIDPCTGNWAPVVRDTTVNQGLESYTPLVRGKTTLVRLFLTAPACAPTNSVQLVSATLTARDGSAQLASATTTPNQLGETYPTMDSYVAGVPTDSPASPKFRLPAFGSSSTSPGAFTATFDALVTYRYSSLTTGTVTKTQSYSGVTSATVGTTPNPLRVLLVPMGDATQPIGSQFPEARFAGSTPINGQYADTVVQNGMQALSRLMPVADGIGDLTSSTGGLRYRLNDAAMIDLGPSRNGLDLMPDGKFCGSAESLFQARATGTIAPTVASELAAHLSAWNKANVGHEADRVVGVVWQSISKGAIDDCAEGYATFDGSMAFVRLLADTTVTSTNPPTANPSMTGSLLAMELSHGFGGVLSSDPRHNGDGHSRNVTADPAATQRAYDTVLARWLTDPRSALQYSGNSTGYVSPSTGTPNRWHDDATLLEKEDWLLAQCRLTPTMPTADCPAAVTETGTVGAGAQASSFVLSGHTDGTREGTELHTSFAADAEQTPADDSSRYRLVQRDGSGAVVSDLGIPVSFRVSAHGHDLDGVLADGYLQAVLPAAPAATRFEVWNGTPGTSCAASSTCLYTRTPGTAPAIVLPPVSGALGGLTPFTSDSGSETAPALSPDGQHVAFVRNGQTFVQRRNVTTNTATGPRSAPLSGSEPAWSPDGRSLAYATAEGDIHLVAVDRTTQPVAFSGDTVLYNHLLQTPPPLGSSAASHPTFSPDGRYVAVAINGGIWRLTRSAASNLVLCQLATLELGTDCVPLATDGDNAAPAWGVTRDGSGRTFIAYSRSDGVWTLDPAAAGFDRKRRLPGASQPATGAGAVVVQLGDGVHLVDPRATDATGHWTAVTRLATGADPSLAANGGALALHRGAAAQQDVFVGTLGSSTGSFSFTVLTEEDPALLRADLYVSCAGSAAPILVALRPTSTSDGPPRSATFSGDYNDARACPGGTISAQVTNGWTTSGPAAIRTVPYSPAPPGPAPAVGAPSPGTTFGQYEPVIAVGSSVDATAGTNSAESTDVWTLTGPAGSPYTARQMGSGSPLQLNPPTPGGWTPGSWTLVRTVTNGSGVTSSTTTSYTVLPDPHHFGVNTVTAVFQPQTLFVPSSGNSVAITVSPRHRALSAIDPSTVRIARAGGLPTDIPLEAGPAGWVANKDGSYTAKFSRQALTCALQAAGGVGGYQAVVISGSGPGAFFSGYDPVYPRTSPSDGSINCS